MVVFTLQKFSGHVGSVKDEVETFVNTRYIFASESHWRTSRCDLHSRKLAIIKLNCHLPGDQSVLHKKGQESIAVA